MGRISKYLNATEKPCTRCGEVKPIEDFRKSKNVKSGRGSICKACDAAYARRYYSGNRDKRIKKVIEWNKANPEKHLGYLKQHYKRNKDNRQRVARREVSRLIRNGSLIPQPCMYCGEAKSEAHHIDYTYPTAVAWMCESHHQAWHRVFEAD